MRNIVRSVRRRGEESGSVEEYIPAPDSGRETKALVEELIRPFPHKGYNEEYDYWWARTDDEPAKIYRWELSAVPVDPA